MKVKAQAYSFSAQDIDYITCEVRKLLEGQEFLTLGRYGEQFEKEFATYHGAVYAVATSSGTGALEIILQTLKLEGKEVANPPTRSRLLPSPRYVLGAALSSAISCPI